MYYSLPFAYKKVHSRVFLRFSSIYSCHMLLLTVLSVRYTGFRQIITDKSTPKAGQQPTIIALRLLFVGIACSTIYSNNET